MLFSFFYILFKTFWSKMVYSSCGLDFVGLKVIEVK